MNRENLCKIIKRIYLDKENEIRGRIEEFRHIGTLGSNEDIFFELVSFVIMENSLIDSREINNDSFQSVFTLINKIMTKSEPKIVIRLS